MSQKVNPNSFRFGINKNWVSRWQSPNNLMTAQWVLEDERIRKVLYRECKKVMLGSVEIDRSYDRKTGKCHSLIYLFVGESALLQSDESMYKLEHHLKRVIAKNHQFRLRVKQIPNPMVSARIIGSQIINSLEEKVSFRNSSRYAMKNAMFAGAKGIKVRISGRLNGAEIARSEAYSDGLIPLSTIKADIEYFCGVAKTTYGILGVKVWINRGFYEGKHFMSLPKPPEPEDRIRKFY